MAFEKKDPFASLDEEWKDAVVAATVEEIDTRIAELAKAEEANLKAKKEDPDLLEKKEQVKLASEGYREATKGYRLRLKYIMRVLSDKAKI